MHIPKVAELKFTLPYQDTKKKLFQSYDQLESHRMIACAYIAFEIMNFKTPQTDVETRFSEYKLKLNEIKLHLKNEEKWTKKYYEYRNIKEEIKITNPRKLEAVDIIYKKVIKLYFQSTNDNENGFFPINYQKHIKKSIFCVRKNCPLLIVYETDKKHVFVVTKGIPGNPNVIGIAMNAGLCGKGGYGVVYDVEYINKNLEGLDPTPKIMKIAIDESGIKNVISEAQKLKVLANCEGIQNNLYLIFEEGYIAEKYTGGDGLTAICSFRFRPEDMLCVTRQLINGLNNIFEKLMCHRDIKPQNFLFKKVDNRFDFVIGDFGSASYFKDILDDHFLPPINTFFRGATYFTVSFVIYSIIEKLIESTEKTLEGNDFAREKIIKGCNDQIIDLLHKNDQFALGIALYILFTRRDPPLGNFRFKDSERKKMNKVDTYTKIDFLQIELMREKLRSLKVPGEVIAHIIARLSFGIEKTHSTYFRV
jgi:hypothetical protein